MTRTVSRAELTARRKAFRDRFPPLVFGDIRIHGANRSQTKYITRTVQNKSGSISYSELKPAYFRLYADKNIAHIYPRATFDRSRQVYDLDLQVKTEKDLEVRFGGMFSSRPINTGMAAIRYNLFGRSSAHIDALS